ncbi:CMP-N-acetylneuraminate-poly-alpha-2,8-sialyltransferase-like [Amphiura filiformis]|uniref:CMP-N-acetylneuraminate-poly-alpha-2, 8-sialyltransferase-like n=1 Tax=Amphiura filiformis TaxID=82378 RepID=UPI003B20FB2A
MRVRSIYLCICLICLVHFILIWMTSINLLNKIVSYRRLVVERYKTTWTMEIANPFIMNSSRLLVTSLGSNSTTKNEVLIHGSHPQAATSAGKMIHEAAKTMLKNLRDLAQMLPNGTGNGTDNFISNVSSILAKPWRHEHNNTKLFRLFLTKETNTIVYDEMMLTQKHRKKNDKSGGIGYPKKNLFPKPPYISCSVVGSSGILLGSKCGRLIDDKDFVIRFNLATLAGFEEDVGIKTNMTTMNPTIVRKYYGGLKKESDRVNFVQSKLVDQDGLIWTPPQDLNRTMGAIKLLNNSKLTLVRGNMRHFHRLGKFWSRYGLNHLLTTGFYFVNCALNLCSELHLFGFWPFATSLDGRTIPAHYYDDIKLSTSQHNASYELRLLLAMHQLGMLKFHIDKCSAEDPKY